MPFNILSNENITNEEIIEYVEKVQEYKENKDIDDVGSEKTNENCEIIEPCNLKITFTGDVLLASYKNQTTSGSFNEYAKNKDATYFLQNVCDIFLNDDLTIVNLENVLTDSNLKEVQKALNGMSINKSASHMRSLTQSMAKEFQSIQTKAQSMKTQLEKALKVDKNVANIQGFKDIYKELQNISNFKIDFNSDLAERDIANLNSKLKELETKTKSLNIDVKSTGKFDKLQNEIDSLDRKIKELRDNQIDFDVDDSELKEAERLLDKLKGYKLGNIDAGGWKQIDTDIGNCNKSIKNYSSEVKKASKASDSGASSGFKWAKNLNDALSTYTPIYMASRLLTSATEGTVQSIIDFI